LPSSLPSELAACARKGGKPTKLAWNEESDASVSNVVAVAGAGLGNDGNHVGDVEDLQGGANLIRGWQTPVLDAGSPQPSSRSSLDDAGTEEDAAATLKENIQYVMGGAKWNLIYSAVIIVQVAMLSIDRWDAPRSTKTLSQMYNGFALLFFFIELVAVWATSQRDEAHRLSQIIPCSPPDSPASKASGRRNDNGALETNRTVNLASSLTPSIRLPDEIESVVRATNVIKIILFATGVAGMWTGDPILTHSQALRVFWPAILVFPVLRALLSATWGSMLQMLNLAIFISINIICWSCLGRYVIGDSLNAVSRSNFGDLPTSMLTLFQIFTGDSWTAVLYQVLESHNEQTYQQVLGATFVLAWLIFSNVALRNLLVSVIVDSFNVAATVEEIHESHAVFRSPFTSSEPDLQGRVSWFGSKGPSSFLARFFWKSQGEKGDNNNSVVDIDSGRLQSDIASTSTLRSKWKVHKVQVCLCCKFSRNLM
jgi:hypothetical protein